MASLWFVFVDDSFECFVLSGIGESWAGAAAVRNDHETDWGGFGFASPFKESLGNAPGCGPFGLPCVDVGLPQLGQLDVVVDKPAEEVDGHSDFLFGARRKVPRVTSFICLTSVWGVSNATGQSLGSMRTPPATLLLAGECN